MTSAELAAIRERRVVALDGFDYYSNDDEAGDYLIVYDVPALLAEVERLRTALQEVWDAETSDLMLEIARAALEGKA